MDGDVQSGFSLGCHQKVVVTVSIWPSFPKHMAISFSDIGHIRIVWLV